MLADIFAKLVFSVTIFLIVFILSFLFVITLIAPYWPILMVLGLSVGTVYVVYNFWLPLLLVGFAISFVWPLFSGQSD